MLNIRSISQSYRIVVAPSHANVLIRRLLASQPSASISSTGTNEKVQLPRKIHRNPTDILYALSATVGTDSTAAHYKFHDDPYLIPMSNIGKRTFAMAQEAGRKAAKWIRQEHKQQFQVNIEYGFYNINA